MSDRASSIDTPPDPRALRRQRIEAARAELVAASRTRRRRGRQALNDSTPSHGCDRSSSCSRRPGRSRSRSACSRSAATAAASCASTRTSTCWCCLPAPIGAEDERFLHAFLNPIWDLGLTIGHHVREVHEGARLAEDNPEFLLALTDARDRSRAMRRCSIEFARRPPSRRECAGGRSMRSGRSSSRGTPASTTRSTSSSRTSRRRLAVCAICSARRPIAKLTDPALLGAGRLRSACAWTMPKSSCCGCVRSSISRPKRHHNVLSHELQERAAARLGYRGSTPRQQVERLMGEYFRHARAIDRSLRWALQGRADADRPQPRACR
mgnify:CR=1 FL=1